MPLRAVLGRKVKDCRAKILWYCVCHYAFCSLIVINQSNKVCGTSASTPSRPRLRPLHCGNAGWTVEAQNKGDPCMGFYECHEMADHPCWYLYTGLCNLSNPSALSSNLFWAMENTATGICWSTGLLVFGWALREVSSATHSFVGEW